MNGFTAVIVVAGLALCQQPKATSPVADPSDDFFRQGAIPNLRIQVSEPELEKLKAENRTYVRCTIIENRKTTYADVGIKLKGAAGSFRDWDDRPALTLNTNKFAKAQKFHGLDKFHLNNSVQDETYCHEWLCEEICRAAGIPATRVTHARVWLNDRDMGLYVLKEGFDEPFLKRQFQDGRGNLYDGGFLQDIDVELEKDSGKGPDDHSDLKELLAACQEPDVQLRWKRIDELLDVDAFVSFMAMELMTCHWDGYTQNRNNYRIYFNPRDKKAHFLPHGMDQMFGDPNASVLDLPGAIVSSAVMQNPEWRKLYRQRLEKLLPLFHPSIKLNSRVEVLRRRLQPALAAIDPQLARDHADRVREFKNRITERSMNLKIQTQQEDPRPPEFDENGRMQLGDWYTAAETEDAVLEEVELEAEKKRTFSIACGPGGRCVASWRRKILLAKGSYSFLALVKTSDVGMIEDEKGSGAGLRISGDGRTNSVSGTSNWKSLQFDFQIEEEVREVELVAELRTTSGQVWFDADSLILARRAEAEKPDAEKAE